MDWSLILVGIDFSAGAAAALREARSLAWSLDSVLDLVHVVQGSPNGHWTSDPAAVTWMRAAHLSPRTLVVRRGVPWVELARRADETGAAIMVVGSHGRSGYQPVALGSTAARLAVAAPCPVLVARSRLVGAPSDVNAHP